MDRITKPSNLHGLRSRSSSANSGSGCTSPARSPRPRSPSPPGTRDHLSNWSASVPALNAERHFENGHNHGLDNVQDKHKSRTGLGKFDKNYGKENRLDDRPEKPEKPETDIKNKKKKKHELFHTTCVVRLNDKYFHKMLKFHYRIIILIITNHVVNNYYNLNNKT